MTGIDPTIQPATPEEKEALMRERQGLAPEPAGEVTPEAATTEEPAVTKPRAKARVRKAKK